MKVLRNVALSLLAFLLFLSLSIFGIAFMINSTALNPHFVTSEFNKLDISSLAKESIMEQSTQGVPAGETDIALVNAVSPAEPLIKSQVNSVTYSTYDYLLGKSRNLNLPLIIKNTFLSQNFVVSLVDKVDLSFFVRQYLEPELSKNIPAELDFLNSYLDEALVNAVNELKPWIKEQLSAAVDPTAGYLLGERQSFNITVSLEPVKETLKHKLWEALQKSPPPQLAMIPQSMQQTLFNQYYDQFTRDFTTIELNESKLGTELPGEIASAFAEAKSGLVQARQYISYFQTGYIALIAFMILLIVGIVLISRQVKDITRRLGITFLTYGAFELAGVFITEYFAGKQLQQQPDIPASLQPWVNQFLNNFLSPLEKLSLALLIGGIALLVVSFIYKPRQS